MKDIYLYITSKLDAQKGGSRDFSDCVDLITITTEMGGMPGQAVFDLPAGEDKLALGSVVQIKKGDVGLFYGYIFTVEANEGEFITVTAFDQIRYLRNQDTMVIGKKTAPDIFKSICNEFGLSIGEVASVSYNCAPVVHDGVALWDIIETAGRETMRKLSKSDGKGNLTEYGPRLMVRDSFGSLDYVDIDSLDAVALIDDKHVISGFTFSNGIGPTTYNKIKIYKEAESLRGLTIAESKEGIVGQDDVGILQMTKKVGKETPDSILKSLADGMLAVYCRPERKLALECLGIVGLRAGDRVKIDLYATSVTDEAGDTELNEFFVASCSHSYQDNFHTMNVVLDFG